MSDESREIIEILLSQNLRFLNAKDCDFGTKEMLVYSKTRLFNIRDINLKNAHSFTKTWTQRLQRQLDAGNRDLAEKIKPLAGALQKWHKENQWVFATLQTHTTLYTILVDKKAKEIIATYESDFLPFPDIEDVQEAQSWMRDLLKRMEKFVLLIKGHSTKL